MRDDPGNFGRPLRRVEGERVGPDETEPLAKLLIAQAVERDAEALGIRELAVALAGPAEVGVELEAVADIDDDQEGRPAVLDRERLGVTLCLAPSALHGDAPILRSPDGGAFPRLDIAASEQRQLLFELLIRTLFRLHDEGVAPVQVDEAGAGRAIRVGEPDRVLEGITVGRRIAPRGLRPIDAKHITQLGRKRLEVGALGRAG